MNSLALLAFNEKYPAAKVRDTLAIFVRRFYTQQFKRTTLPAGPKVGSVSLSPRGDWRMPDEADFSAAMAEVEELD